MVGQLLISSATYYRFSRFAVETDWRCWTIFKYLKKRVLGTILVNPMYLFHMELRDLEQSIYPHMTMYQ